MLRNFFLCFCTLIFSLALLVEPADAAKKRKKRNKKTKTPCVQVDEATAAALFSADVTLANKKKKKKNKKKSPKTLKVSVQCMDTTPGLTRTNKKGQLQFCPYNKLAKQYRKKKGARNKNKAKQYKQLAKKGPTQCKRPPFADLRAYTGNFGPAEARTLLERFAFGASDAEVQRAVAEGLNATVNRLMTFTPEPWLDAEENELRCDGRLSSDENNEECNPDNPNDVYFPGVRYGIYYRLLYTQNPFHHKLWFFLHDERITASSAALGSCERHALVPYVEYLRYAATSGDYIHPLRRANSDLLMHLNWLDGRDNHAGLLERPNENYAREFWELMTVGPTALDGSPVYGDRDVSQAALAFSGNHVEGFEVDDEYWVCLGSFSGGLHDPSVKTVFAGTPFQANVFGAEDLLQATLRHDRTAEHLAEDMWKEFIGPNRTPTTIRQLAHTIRSNNYNLLPAFRELMRSRALYAAENRKALIKHPLELLIGFLRMTKLPIPYDDIDDILEDMGQRPLLPATVFGWDDQRLAGESFVLEWRNAVLWMLNWSIDSLEEEGFSFYDRFLQGIEGAPFQSSALVDRMSAEFGVPINGTQRAHLVQYLDYNRKKCGSKDSHPDCEAGGTHKLVRDVFDAHPEADEDFLKTRGIIVLMAMSPDYRVK